MLSGQTSADRKAFEEGFKAGQAAKAGCETPKESSKTTPYSDDSHKTFESMSDEIVGETFEKDIETLNCAKKQNESKEN